MTPLEVRIAAGLEDTRLEHHIGRLEEMAKLGGVSEVELRTLALCYSRLDALTDPALSKVTVRADPRLGLRR